MTDDMDCGLGGTEKPCDTCARFGGRKPGLVKREWLGLTHWVPCPDCTPENVETVTDRAVRTES